MTDETRKRIESDAERNVREARATVAAFKIHLSETAAILEEVAVILRSYPERFFMPREALKFEGTEPLSCATDPAVKAALDHAGIKGDIADYLTAQDNVRAVLDIARELNLY
jgi:hypothetical protein